MLSKGEGEHLNKNIHITYYVSKLYGFNGVSRISVFCTYHLENMNIKSKYHLTAILKNKIRPEPNIVFLVPLTSHNGTVASPLPPVGFH